MNRVQHHHPRVEIWAAWNPAATLNRLALLSHPPADVWAVGRRRVEVSSTEADVGRPRRAVPLEASHPSPLSIPPSVDSRQDLHEAQSMWLRVTSVSAFAQRPRARIYEFLTGSRDRETASECRETASTNRICQDPLYKFGSTTLKRPVSLTRGRYGAYTYSLRFDFGQFSIERDKIAPLA